VSAPPGPAARSVQVICELARLASCGHRRARTHQPYVTGRKDADRLAGSGRARFPAKARCWWRTMLAVYRQGQVRAGIVRVGEPGEARGDG
jgi:hypothetical protein